MKTKQKTNRATHQRRRIRHFNPKTTTTQPANAPAQHRHDFLVLCIYPGMTTRPDTDVAA